MTVQREEISQCAQGAVRMKLENKWEIRQSSRTFGKYERERERDRRGGRFVANRIPFLFYKTFISCRARALEYYIRYIIFHCAVYYKYSMLFHLSGKCHSRGFVIYTECNLNQNWRSNARSCTIDWAKSIFNNIQLGKYLSLLIILINNNEEKPK